MKRILLSISVIALVGMFVSCTGNDPKNDAKKLTDKLCECANIEDEAEQTSCMDKYDMMYSLLKERYKDDSASLSILNQAIMDCPCANQMTEMNFDLGLPGDDQLTKEINDAVNDVVDKAMDEMLNDLF